MQENLFGHPLREAGQLLRSFEVEDDDFALERPVWLRGDGQREKRRGSDHHNGCIRVLRSLPCVNALLRHTRETIHYLGALSESENGIPDFSTTIRRRPLP